MKYEVVDVVEWRFGRILVQTEWNEVVVVLKIVEESKFFGTGTILLNETEVIVLELQNGTKSVRKNKNQSDD
jgi:hypothetical protein